MPGLVHGLALTKRRTKGSEVTSVVGYGVQTTEVKLHLVASCTSIQSQKRSFHFLTDLALHTLFVCIVLFWTSYFLFVSF